MTRKRHHPRTDWPRLLMLAAALILTFALVYVYQADRPPQLEVETQQEPPAGR